MSDDPVGDLFEKSLLAHSEMLVGHKKPWYAPGEIDLDNLQDHLSPEDWKEIHDEMRAQNESKNDRAIAIIYAALLEDRLKWLIERVFIETLTNKQRKFFFDGAGPLSSALAKVKFLHALGIIPLILSEEIEELLGIRNKFAHSIRKVYFSDDAIHKLCMGLKKYSGGSLMSQKNGRLVYALTAMSALSLLILVGQRAPLKTKP